MESESVIALRRRTMVGGALLWVLFLGLSVSALVLEGASPPLALAPILALVAGAALFSVFLSADISVAGYPLDPFQRVGAGYALLALAVVLVYAPRVALAWGTLAPLSWVLILVGFAYQEWTGPHETFEPSMRQVAIVVGLMMSVVIAIPIVMILLG